MNTLERRIMEAGLLIIGSIKRRDPERGQSAMC